MLLRCLRGTNDYGIFYNKWGSENLVAYTNSDYVGDLEDKKKTLQAMFFLWARELFYGHLKYSQ